MSDVSYLKLFNDRLRTLYGDVPDTHGRPCLAEDWFVEDYAPRMGNIYPNKGECERHLRSIYRWARRKNIENAMTTGVYIKDPHLLMLHQVTDLLTVMWDKASEIFQEQQRDRH